MGGTGHRLQPTVTQTISDYIDAGKNDSAIQVITGVDRKCIAKLRKNLRYWGVPYPPSSVVQGRPSTLRQAHIDGLADYLHGHPQAYLDEMMGFLFDEYCVTASQWTVYRALKKLRWSRKVATKRAKEQSEPLRRTFRARVGHLYQADQIVAIDESACNERTGDRKYGWSAINTPVELVYSMKRSERWSLLPAMTVDGYLAFTMYQGAITSDILEDFLEHSVLPYCTPGYSVLVMDNASIHRSPRVAQLCHEFAVGLEYLPPYSPDYNPIERSFKELKSWIKRNYRLAEQYNDYGYFLYFAVLEVCCERDCKMWFARCGYPLSRDKV